jgi:hypothetical protein
MSMASGTLPDDGNATFTTSERNEIIARLTAVENTVTYISGCVDRIEEFTDKLSTVLDALGGNPMLAAMMPPDVARSMMGE